MIILFIFIVYDSSSRQINGIHDGNFLNLGDFQECLNIRIGDQFAGKYFLINLVPVINLDNSTKSGLTREELEESNYDLERRFQFLFQFPNLINVKLGVCLPGDCANEEIQTLFNQTINRFHWKIQNKINGQINENLWTRLRSSSNHVKFSFAILIAILSIVIISTILDFCNFKFKSVQAFVKSASIRSNYVKLHSNDTNEKQNNFVSKNRYYSEIMVNISHFVVFVPLLGGSIVHEHIFDWIEHSNKIYFQLFFCDCYYPGIIMLASTTVSLKMFHFIKTKATGLKLAENAVKRMCNFWPILIVLIAIQIALPLFIDGPLVHELIKPLSLNCERYWYLNLLFMNNILSLPNTCLPYTWTISAELQLYLIASLLTYLYIRRPKLALSFNIVLIAIGILANVFVIYTELTKPNVVFFPFDYESMRNSIFYSHSNTLVQLSPYFTIFLAFYLRLTKRSLKMSIVSFKQKKKIILILI